MNFHNFLIPKSQGINGVNLRIINSEVEDLNGNRKKEQKVPQKAVIGIGAGRNYTLYDVGTFNTQFVQAGYKSEKRTKGFGRL